MSLGKDCVLLTAVCWSGLTVQSKFEEIRKSNMVAAQRLVQSHYSSSSSDEEDEEIGTRDVKKGKILASTFTTYTVQTGNTKKSYVFWSFPDSTTTTRCSLPRSLFCDSVPFCPRCSPWTVNQDIKF